MSKYSTKQHIIVGHDNIFFYHDEDGCHDFRAVLWIEPYHFKQINTINYFIKRPAYHLLFKEYEKEVFEETHDMEYCKSIVEKTEKKIHTAEEWYKIFNTRTKTFTSLRTWWKNYFDKNCPGWGFPEERCNETATIFFNKVSHAWNTRKFIIEQLKEKKK